MTKHEKKQLEQIIETIEDAQADVTILLTQEQDRLDSIGNSPSQIDRAIRLESNIDNLKEADENLSSALCALEDILN